MVITVKILDGKQDTIDESRITYRVGIPATVYFYFRDGIQYTNWYTTENVIVSVPTSQIVCVEP